MRGYFFRRFVKTSNRWCLEGRAERDVWATNKGTSEDDAMSKYVAVADRVGARGRGQLRLALVAPSTGVLARSARHARRAWRLSLFATLRLPIRSFA